jgi:hypothetical protein
MVVGDTAGFAYYLKNGHLHGHLQWPSVLLRNITNFWHGSAFSEPCVARFMPRCAKFYAALCWHFARSVLYVDSIPVTQW